MVIIILTVVIIILRSEFQLSRKISTLLTMAIATFAMQYKVYKNTTNYGVFLLVA